MTKTTKTILWIVVALIVIGGIWYGVGRKSQKEGVIKIGVIGPLIGSVAEYGQNVKNAIDLATEEINNAGGIKGRKIQLIYEDSGSCEPTKGVTAIQKLINIDKVSIVIDEACSSVALAEAPIAEENKVLLMLPTATNYKIKEAGDYIFRIIPSDAFQGKRIAELVISEGHRKVAVIYINNDYGFGLKKVFKEEFEKNRGEIVIVETHGTGEIDFRSLISKVKGMNPEAIFLADLPTEGALILKQLKELGVDVPVYASEGMKDDVVIQTARSAVENLIVVFPSQLRGENYGKFEQSYKDRYGKTPESYAVYGYDALKLLGGVIERVGSDAAKVKDGLYNIKGYEGVTGIINFDSFGERIGAEYSIYIVKNGQFVPYEE